MATEMEDIEQQQTPAEPAQELERPQFQVDLSEDDDEDEGQQQAQPEGKKGRRAAYRDLKKQFQAEKEARAALERQLAEIRGQVQGLASRPAPAVQQQPQQDPNEEKIESLWLQQQNILARINGDPNLAGEQAAKLQAEWRKLDRQRRKLEIEADTGGSRAQAPSREDIENQILESEFPEVFGNPVALQRAKAELMALVQQQGRQPNLAMAREAAKRVSASLSRRVPAPSEAEKAKHAGVSGRPGTAPGASTFTPTKLHVKSALAYYDHLSISDEEKVRKYVKEVLKPNGLV